MTKVYVLIALFFILVTLLKLFRPQIKGWFGEMVLDTVLKIKLDKSRYSVLHNILLPTDDGATTQIDHIVVSQWGIFVIETKTYSGWVFGDAKSPQWTVTHFKRKDRFQNPLRQNYKHLATLSECLGIPLEYFRTIVAFSGETVFKTEMPKEVMLFSDVADYILRHSSTPIIKEEQVPEVVEVIMEWQGTLSRERRAAHVENLRKNHPAPKEQIAIQLPDSPDANATPVCPKCGASMVKRSRKSDGEQFWGCSNYPRCRGVIQ